MKNVFNSTNLVCICWFSTTAGVWTPECFTCAALRTLVRSDLWMFISKVLTLASDWLSAILWYIVVTLTLTATSSTWYWDRSGLRQCLIICLVLFVPNILRQRYFLKNETKLCRNISWSLEKKLTKSRWIHMYTATKIIRLKMRQINQLLQISAFNNKYLIIIDGKVALQA